MIYVFDLDGTLCRTPHDGRRWEYERAEPIPERIAAVNRLKEAGHTVLIDSARGCDSGVNYLGLTTRQVREWGIKADKVRVGTKWGGDLFVDDRGMAADAFFEGLHG